MPLVQNPDGTSTWVDDAGAPMFGVPQQASGPAALLAMKSDVDAGIQREPGYYGGIALGKMPSMATGPDALAQGPAPVGSKALDIADIPIGGGSAGAPAAPSPPTAEPGVGWQAEAARAVAPRPGQSPEAAGSGGAGSDDPIAWAKAAAAADTAREKATDAVIAKDNAERAAKGLPPVKLPGQADASTADGGAKAAPGKIIMASGGQSSAGASGRGGERFDPRDEWNRQGGAGGAARKAGFDPSTKTVQRDGTQSNETLGLQIGADEATTKAQQGEAMTRSAGAAAASKVFDDMVAEDMTAKDAVARSGAALAERTNAGLADISQRIAELKSAEVDPGRKWKSLGPGGELAQTLAIVAGQIGAAMMKSDKNMVLEIIQKGIDRDVEAQRYNLEHQRKGIGDEEKLLQLNKDRFSNEAAALDAQRALGLHAATSKLEALKQATQSQLERDNISTMQAQLQRRAADLIAGVEAKQAGTVNETYKYHAASSGGSGKLTFDQLMRYGGYKQEERKLDIAEGKGGKSPMSPEVGKDLLKRREGARERAAAAQSMLERDNKFGSSLSASEQKADAADREKLASGTSAQRGEGVTNKDNMDRADDTFGQSAFGTRGEALRRVVEDAKRKDMQYTELLRRMGADPEQLWLTL